MMAILVFNELAIKDDPLKVHSEPCQTSKMERFAKIVNGENSKYFRKRSILDVWQDSENASDPDACYGSGEGLKFYKAR